MRHRDLETPESIGIKLLKNISRVKARVNFIFDLYIAVLSSKSLVSLLIST